MQSTGVYKDAPNNIKTNLKIKKILKATDYSS